MTVNLCYLNNVNRALIQQFDREVPRRLGELMGIPLSEVKIEREFKDAAESAAQVDWVVSAGGVVFVGDCKPTGRAAEVASAVRAVRSFADRYPQRAIPLVAVPYMGPVGQRLCAEAHVCWLDLSGNAYLVAPGLRINIEGRPNQFKEPGRPGNLFAPKSSRIARRLLLEPDRPFRQRELAKVSGLDEGFTSRIVRKLEEQRLVARNQGGAIQVADFDALLDAWRETYDFSKHHIVRGHIAARSSDDLVRQLSSYFEQRQTEHAVTGLAGAWLLCQFAGFRLVVIYVDQMPSPEAQKEMGFREEPRGENVWLVVPNDSGVFQGASDREGIRCVHPIQLYLDLQNHPERSAEAAEKLRDQLLKKASHA